MTARRRKPAVERRGALTERDRLVLGLIGAAGQLRTDVIADELFPSAHRARARLRLLFDAGLVERHLIDSRSPDLYTLTAAGAAVASAPVGTVLHVPRRAPSLSTLLHGELIATTYCYLRALCIETPDTTLARWERGRGALAEEATLSGMRIVPDALAVVRSSSGDAVIAAEADTGTEPVGTLTRKLGAFDKALRNGAQVAELWLVAPDRGGASRLWTAAERFEHVASRTRLMTGPAMRVRPVAPPPARGTNTVHEARNDSDQRSGGQGA